MINGYVQCLHDTQGFHQIGVIVPSIQIEEFLRDENTNLDMKTTRNKMKMKKLKGEKISRSCVCTSTKTVLRVRLTGKMDH